MQNLGVDAGRSQRRAYGQYFTPEPVVAFCYTLLSGALPASPRIVDPACGDGAFLRYAAHSIAKPSTLYGCDIDPALANTLAAAGLPGVRHADGLLAASLPDRSFDLVVGNPPFGVAARGEDGPARVSEVRFLLRALDIARPGGYVALILPSGVLANERLRGVRAEVLGRCTALAVVTLPRQTFRYIGTSAACSVVVLRVRPAPSDHHVFMALAERLDDLPRIARAYCERAEAENRKIENISPRLKDSAAVSRAFWMLQTAALEARMDPSFWRPDYRAVVERLSERHSLRPLGEIIDRRHELIAGDHVRPSRGEQKGPGLPYEYYQTREFMPAGYNYTAVERCDERAYQRLKRTAVQRGDLLVSCAGVGGAGKGRVCLITHQPGPSCTGDVLLIRASRIAPVFLFLFLASRHGRTQLLRLQNGVGTSNLSADELLQVQVPLLPAAAQRDLAASYRGVALAHARAMGALAHGKMREFHRQRDRSEQLLTRIQGALERLLL